MSKMKVFLPSTTSVRRAIAVCSVGVTMAAVSSQVSAGCAYVLDSQWDTGFSARLRITNNTGAPINGWTLGIQYAGDNRIVNPYNVTLTGTNPYVAKDAGWNGAIAVGAIPRVWFWRH